MIFPGLPLSLAANGPEVICRFVELVILKRCECLGH